MKQILKLIATAVVVLCAATSCGSDVAVSPVADSTLVSADSEPAVSAVSDSVAESSGEEEFQCLLALQDVTATFGMAKDARRVTLKKVFSELPESANERIRVYQSAVRKILDSENSDLTDLDSLTC